MQIFSEHFYFNKKLIFMQALTKKDISHMNYQ